MAASPLLFFFDSLVLLHLYWSSEAPSFLCVCICIARRSTQMEERPLPSLNSLIAFCVLVAAAATVVCCHRLVSAIFHYCYCREHQLYSKGMHFVWSAYFSTLVSITDSPRSSDSATMVAMRATAGPETVASCSRAVLANNSHRACSPTREATPSLGYLQLHQCYQYYYYYDC